MWSALPAISGGHISMRAALAASCSTPTTTRISATSIVELGSPLSSRLLRSFPPGAGQVPTTKESKREKAIASHFRLHHLRLSVCGRVLLPGFYLGHCVYGTGHRAVSYYGLLAGHHLR